MKPATRIKAELELMVAARAWALADRTADDQAAAVNQCETTIIEVATANQPVPESVLRDRDAAVHSFRAACVAEGDAEEVFHDAARRLLDLEDQHG